MIGLFGLLFGIIFTFQHRVSWPIGVVILVTSLAMGYLGATHRRFDCWFEFGDRLKSRDFSGIHTHDWGEVKETFFVSGNEGTEIIVMLNNNKKISIEEAPETLRKIVTALVTGLNSKDPDTRKCLAGC